MSIFKKLLPGAIATSLLLCSLSTFANLKITNNSTITNITVKCSGENGSVDGMPISSKQTRALSWRMVSLIIGRKGSCDFYKGITPIAAAGLELTPNLKSARITTLNVYDPQLNVQLNPGVGVYQSDISVVVSGT